MTARHRVVWTQGLFLQPHHFQQESRFLEHQIDARVVASQPHAWGFSELTIDEGQLALGYLCLVRARGVLPDGTPFSIPDLDALPPPLEVDAKTQNELLCLAAPRRLDGVTEVDFADGAADPVARYDVQDHALRDHTNASDEPEPVQLGALRLRLLRQAEATKAHAALGVVRLVERRADGQLVLDRGYLPPQTRIDASGQLSVTAGLVHSLVQHRARALAGGMGQLSHQVSEVADVMMLQLLNRHEPLLRQMAGGPSVHPWVLYAQCLQLAGELSTFLRTERCPPEYPLYRHDDLQSLFTPLLKDLREMLSSVINPHAIKVELKQHSPGAFTATVHEAELMRTAGFVLAIRSQMPTDQVRLRFPAQSKFASAERIRDLIHGALPGVPMRSLPVAPRQLPFHAGSHYFDLERQGELWKQCERSGNLALFVSGEFPELEVELWAIRQP